MNKKISQITVSINSTIRETMILINDASLKGVPSGIAIVTTSDNILIGIVTDGDIRRALVNKIDMETRIEEIMVRDPITVPKGLSESEMFELVTEKAKASNRLTSEKVDKVIIIDNKKRVDDVINLFDLWEACDIKNKDVLVVGLGYVGLTLSAVLADVGFKVIGYDINKDIMKSIKQGEPPFFEKGLSSLLKFHVSNKNLRTVSTLKKGLANVFILCVGTPLEKNNKPSLKFIKNAAKLVGKILKKRDLIILRSTVPVGTSQNVVLPILEKESGLRGGEDFFLSFAPERTTEGNALMELRSLPQVIGGPNIRSLNLASELFSNLNKTIVRLSSLEAAEMVKLINNAFRDLSFAFSNELAVISDQWNLDVVNIIEAANEGYPRNHIPVPSPGVGGVCLKKDPYIYINSLKDEKIKAGLSSLGREINEYMPMFVSKKIESFIDNYKRSVDVKIFLIGFAFKGDPETSDMRASTSIDVFNLLKNNNGWQLFGYDPIVKRSEIEKLGIMGCGLREGFKNADCAVFLNNHSSYRSMDILGLAEIMNKPAYLFDGWHIFPREEIEKVKGIVYGGLSGKN